jgi:hypothetical protein
MSSGHEGWRPRQDEESLNDFKQMLFISGMPPSGGAGAPVIYRQLLRDYAPEKLDVLYCRSWDKEWRPRVGGTLLPCRHTAAGWLAPGLRCKPARVFGHLARTLNLLRLRPIMDIARKIIVERKVEVIFTATTSCEFNLAAYFLHLETGLPLYFFETDDWEEANPTLFCRYLIRKYRLELLKATSCLWLTSPAMVRDYAVRFGVEGEFLFHFIDPERSATVGRTIHPPGTGPIQLVYTGSINFMFMSTFRILCQHLNSGIEVNGRPVRLSVYGVACAEEFRGPGVWYGGLVHPDAIPEVISSAHASLIAVTFDQDPGLLKLVKTSLYTKTVDYLAVGRPVLVVAPAYSAEVDYFGGVTHVVPSTDRETFAAAVRRLVEDTAYVEQLTADGQEFVRRRHGPQALEKVFLRHFRKGAA